MLLITISILFPQKSVSCHHKPLFPVQDLRYLSGVVVLSLLAKKQTKKKKLLTVDDERCKSRGFTQGALRYHSVLAGVAGRAAEGTEWLVSGRRDSWGGVESSKSGKLILL